MLKLLCASPLFFSLLACQVLKVEYRDPLRCIDSIGRCSQLLDKRQPVEELLNIDRGLIELLQNDSNKYDLAVAKELNIHIDDGNRKYLREGEFVFKSSMKLLKNVGGTNKIAAYHAEHEGRALFIKQIANEGKDSALRQVLYAKILYALGLGPKTDLVRMSTEYYLIMDELPGVNIKEVLRPLWRQRNTRRKIDKMLGIKTKDLAESLSMFANAILGSESYMKRLELIVRRLDENGFSVFDFQFMVDLETGPESIKIIDVESFGRSVEPNTKVEFETGDYRGDPGNTMRGYLETLKGFVY